MQEGSDSSEHADRENAGQRDAPRPAVEDATAGTEIEPVEPSTILAEVRPGVAMVFGDVPPELQGELIGFDDRLVPSIDREQIATALASIGNVGTVGGNLANVLASTQGLYRITESSQALLNAGGALATKGTANLGTILLPGGGLAQARFIPVAAIGTAGAAAAIGPALAMIALQVSLNQVTALAKSNLALTSQVMAEIRSAQWAELTGLVESIDQTVDQARKAGEVAPSLWSKVADKDADLKKQRDQYRRNVTNHVEQIKRLDARGRREYLERNAEAIFFDTNALVSSLKAWLGYQALHAARARADGAHDPAEARLFEVIAHDAPAEFDAALAQITTLVEGLTFELRKIAELPGRTLPLTRKRKDTQAVRDKSTRLLKAIQALADALHRPAPPLEAPDVVCTPAGLDLTPYLHILRWYIDDGETLRCLAFPYQRDAGDVLRGIGHRTLGAIEAEKWASRAGFELERGTTLVAVTDRRIITANPSILRQEGEIGDVVPIDQIRYVRSAGTHTGSTHAKVDLITRDADIRWEFHADTDDDQVDALAAALAESMRIPNEERDELTRRPHAALPAGSEAARAGAPAETD